MTDSSFKLIFTWEISWREFSFNGKEINYQKKKKKKREFILDKFNKFFKKDSCLTNKQQKK